MTILFSNNASTTLASAITSSATSLTVATGQGSLFPTITGSNIFYITLQSATASTPIEIVKVTARSGDTMTIVRAQDGTTASAFNSGDKVELRLPAVVLNDLPQLDATNTFTVDQSISGLTVGKGGGSVSNNTAFGVSALTSNTSGGTNSAFGIQAAYSTTSGNSNTAVGATALYSNVSNSDSTAVGYQALFTSTGGSNTAVGSHSSQLTTTGIYNASFGRYSLYSNTTGGSNTAIGDSAMYPNTTGSNNTAIGQSALNSNTTASNNTAVGYQSLYSNTTGVQSVAIGVGALYTNTQNNNTAIGYNAGYYNTTGAVTAVGSGALLANTTGSYNVGIGGYEATGYPALRTNTTGSYNTAVGYGSLALNTTASNNTAVGYQAGYNNTTGANNTFVGQTAGNNITTGSANIYIGSNPIGSSATVNNEMVITGSGATAGKGGSTGYINMNGGGVYQGNNSAAWSITSDQRLKKNIVDNTVGLSAINAIQVRNFEYRTTDEVTDLPKENAVDIKGVQLGAIAQELALVLPDCVKTESTGVMSVDTSNITWHLINAVKELSAEVTALKAKLGA